MKKKPSSVMQERDKSTFSKIVRFYKVHLYTPSPTYSKIKSQNATIAGKIDFKVEMVHEKAKCGIKLFFTLL